MAEKSSAKSRPTHRPDGKFAKGKPQGPGRGPAKGAANAGRPHDAFKAEMQRLALQPAVLQRLSKILRRPASDDIFLKALHFTTDRGFGKPMQPFEDVNLTPEEREARVRALLGMKG